MNKYIKGLNSLLLEIEVTDVSSKTLSFDAAITKIIDLIIAQNKKGNKIILVGNGGSASIASHIATDFLKNAGVPATAFNDSSLLTCLANDLGYEHVFQKPIEMLALKGDIAFCISSSGKSENILNAAKAAGKKGCVLITLSGFQQDNPLRKLGEINFYVPSYSYGYVEIIHLVICHCIADKIIESKK